MMSRTFSLFALPLSLMASFLVPKDSLAATPIATFGVSATVVAGCSASASAATFYGTYAAAAANAASSVSVNCTNATDYRIAISPETVTGTTVPIASLTFPLRSLMTYAMSSDQARNINRGGMVSPDSTIGTGSGFVQPILTYGEPPNLPSDASSATTGTISVAITY